MRKEVGKNLALTGHNDAKRSKWEKRVICLTSLSDGKVSKVTQKIKREELVENHDRPRHEKTQ